MTPAPGLDHQRVSFRLQPLQQRVLGRHGRQRIILFCNIGGSPVWGQVRNDMSEERFILPLHLPAFSAASQMLLKVLPFLDRQRFRSGERTQLYELLVGPVR